MVEDILPSGWQEVANADHDSVRYNPQSISRFEHTETSVGIRVTPAEPNAGVGTGSGAGSGGGSESGEREGNDGKGEYQVTVGEDVSDSPDDVTPIGDAADHADALALGVSSWRRTTTAASTAAKPSIACSPSTLSSGPQAGRTGGRLRDRTLRLIVWRARDEDGTSGTNENRRRDGVRKPVPRRRSRVPRGRDPLTDPLAHGRTPGATRERRRRF